MRSAEAFFGKGKCGVPDQGAMGEDRYLTGMGAVLQRRGGGVTIGIDRAVGAGGDEAGGLVMCVARSYSCEMSSPLIMRVTVPPPRAATFLISFF